MHKIKPNQKVRVVQLEIAVSADADYTYEMSALLTELGTGNSDSAILDWRYTGIEWDTKAGKTPSEGSIFHQPKLMAEYATKHVIFSQYETEQNDGEPMFWSNKQGWVSLDDATIFDTTDYYLPYGPGGIRWLKLMEGQRKVRHFLEAQKL